MTPTSAASPPRHPRRHLLTCLLAVTVSALALTLSAANQAGADPSGTADVVTTPAAPGTSYAQGTTAQDAQTGTVHYAVPKDVCPAPTKGYASCLSVKLVPAAKGTTGAKAYVTPASLTGPTGGFGPADLASAYAYDRNAASGATQTVAIVDAYDNPNALIELNAVRRELRSAGRDRDVVQEGEPERRHLAAARRQRQLVDRDLAGRPSRAGRLRPVQDRASRSQLAPVGLPGHGRRHGREHLPRDRDQQLLRQPGVLRRLQHQLLLASRHRHHRVDRGRRLVRLRLGQRPRPGLRQRRQCAGRLPGCGRRRRYGPDPERDHRRAPFGDGLERERSRRQGRAGRAGPPGRLGRWLQHALRGPCLAGPGRRVQHHRLRLEAAGRRHRRRRRSGHRLRRVRGAAPGTGSAGRRCPRR